MYCKRNNNNNNNNNSLEYNLAIHIQIKLPSFRYPLFIRKRPFLSVKSELYTIRIRICTIKKNQLTAATTTTTTAINTKRTILSSQAREGCLLSAELLLAGVLCWAMNKTQLLQLSEHFWLKVIASFLFVAYVRSRIKLLLGACVPVILPGYYMFVDGEGIIMYQHPRFVVVRALIYFW